MTAVIPGSRAEAAGLKPGDLIEKVIFKPAEFTHFGYPPSVVYCNCISWLLFKDVRAVWVIFDVLAALLMYALARRCNPGEKGARLCQLLPLTFLFLPRSLFVIEQSWTEPLVVVSMAGFALAAESGRWPALTGALLGLWLSSKQYVVLAIPMVLKLRRWRAATWICAIAVGLALVLPFAIWDFRAMMENVLIFFLKSDARGDALSLYGFAVALGVPSSAGGIGAVVACLWIGGAGVVHLEDAAESRGHAFRRGGDVDFLLPAREAGLHELLLPGGLHAAAGRGGLARGGGKYDAGETR